MATLDDPSPHDHIEDEFAFFANFDSELFEIDCSEFPYYSVQDEAIQSDYNLRLRTSYSWNEQWMRGNYVASDISRGLRIQTRTRHRFSDMRVIFELPTEIVYEIFGHLHPSDLYSWIRTNKAYRSLFLSRGATSIWRSAFLNHPDIPSCPLDLSFPKWITLLFGSGVCDDCGFPDGTVDFAYNYRRCDACMSLKYWYRESLEMTEGSTYLPGFSSERPHLWTLVPRSYKYGGLLYPADYEHDQDPRYLKPDLDKMAETMLGMLLDPNTTTEDYEAFKSSTAASVAARETHAKTCNIWCRGVADKIENLHSEVHPAIVEQYLQKLRNLGYHPSDVEESADAIRWMLYDERSSMVKFNRKVFLRFLPRAREELVDAKCRRLIREAEGRREKREEFVDEIYRKVKRSLDPLEWLSLPSFERVRGKDTLAAFIKTDDETSTMPSEETISIPINEFIVDWFRGGKLLFRSLLPVLTVQEGDNDDYLDLALAVFTCPTHKSTLFGWRNVTEHLNCLGKSDYGDPLDLKFSPRGSKTVTQMITAINCDPETTTVADMDKSNQRFICSHCPPKGKRGSKGQDVLTWREMVAHILSSDEHPSSSFTQISRDVLKSVLFHEPMHPDPSRRAWACKLCSAFIEDPMKRAEITEHIKEKHDIQTPREKRDFFYYPLDEQPKRKPYHLGLDPPAYYCCSKCPPPTCLRLWKQDQLIPHIKNKHSGSSQSARPEENIDYFKLPLED